jgi:multimeric flavodoxin WrbA
VNSPPSRRQVLLVVHHTTSPALQALLEAAIEGTRADGIENLDVVLRPALAATASDVLAADGFLLGTAANIGYMSGALKLFFDTVYYPCLLAKIGAPYGLYVQGNNDTTGAVRSVQAIAKAMGWQPAHEPVEITTQPAKQAAEAVWELAATIAATVAALPMATGS